MAIEDCDPAPTIWYRCAFWDNGVDGYPQRICEANNAGAA